MVEQSVVDARVEVRYSRRRVSGCTRGPAVPSCCHTELTMRLIKPAVARLLALFPGPEKFCPGPPPHC